MSIYEETGRGKKSIEALNGDQTTMKLQYFHVFLFLLVSNNAESTKNNNKCSPSIVWVDRIGSVPSSSSNGNGILARAQLFLSSIQRQRNRMSVSNDKQNEIKWEKFPSN